MKSRLLRLVENALVTAAAAVPAAALAHELAHYHPPLSLITASAVSLFLVLHPALRQVADLLLHTTVHRCPVAGCPFEVSLRQPADPVDDRRAMEAAADHPDHPLWWSA